MKRIINFAGVSYVAFALIAAHTALVSIEATSPFYAGGRSNVEIADKVVRDNQRLPQSDADSYFDGVPTPKPRTDKSCYEVRIWTGDYCSACVKYKKLEVPTLLKLKYRVTYKDYFKDNPPKEVKMLPTIQLVYKGKVISTKVYWKAKDIDKFVMNRLALKR